MRSLRVALLGAPSIEVDGAPLLVDTRKATAIFAVLAVSGHSHTRAVIAELLWPGLDAERSRSALRRTLSALRGGLGDGRLVSDNVSVALDLDGAWFDLAEFRAVAADAGADSATLAAAADLHRDDLLAGFGLREAVEFDDWQRRLQETVRRERAALLDRLVERLSGEGRLEAAIVRARERLALDDLHEPTHRRLIELYAAAGRRGDACGPRPSSTTRSARAPRYMRSNRSRRRPRASFGSSDGRSS
jgi:DNA-binding SARP family transcriptional activator